jgi:hypothetical protein
LGHQVEKKAHPGTSNFDRQRFTAWLRELLASDVRIVTQNGIYDYGWLRADLGLDMPPAERLGEIGALVTLVDENRRIGLNALCAWRRLPGKDKTLLECCRFGRNRLVQIAAQER